MNCKTCGKESGVWLYCSVQCQLEQRPLTVTSTGHSLLKHSVTPGSHNTPVCSECRRPLDVVMFKQGKPRRTTCSDKCRQTRNRRIRDQKSAWIGALHELGKMRDLIKRREHDEKTIEQLKRIKGEIDDLLLLAGDADSMARRQMSEDFARKREAAG